MMQISSAWWKKIAACPYCGSFDIQWPDYSGGEGNCAKCARVCKLDRNVLQWDVRGPGEKSRLLPVFLRRLRSFLHPISSPLLPFRYLTQIRLEHFYQRTLSDPDIAKKWADHYLEVFDLPQDPVVLDFGCGRGRNSGMLYQLGFRVVGQDVKFHSWWHRLSDCGFQVTQVNSNLPWRDAMFDLVVETMVMHYIPDTQLLKHAQEMKRVLKPGGYWLLLESNSKSFGAKEMRRQIGRLHELDKVREMTSSLGFVEIDQSFEGFYAPFFPIVVNFIRKLCSPRPFDLSDYDSWLAMKIKPESRGLWLLRLKK